MPLSSSMFIVEMLSALATGEITGTLKMFEVGGSLEYWGIWSRDALPGDESPRSPQLLLLSESKISSRYKRQEWEKRYLLVHLAKHALVDCTGQEKLIDEFTFARISLDSWRTLCVMYPTDRNWSENKTFLSVFLSTFCLSGLVSAIPEHWAFGDDGLPNSWEIRGGKLQFWGHPWQWQRTHWHSLSSWLRCCWRKVLWDLTTPASISSFGLLPSA